MEKLRMGRLTVYKRPDGVRWSIYFQIGEQRIRRTLDTTDRTIALELAGQASRALERRDYAAIETLLEVPCHQTALFSDALDAFEAVCPPAYRSIPIEQHPSETLFAATVGFDSWEESTWRGNQSIRRQLRFAWSERPLETVSPIMVERLLMERERVSSTTTRNRYLATLNTLLKWCQRHGLLSTLPTREIHRKKAAEHVPEALTADELVALEAQLQPIELRIVRFLQDTGLRMGELIRLEWGDVDLRERVIIIRDNKGSKEFRSVPLTSRAVEILANHRREDEGSARVSLYPHSPRTLRERLEQAAKRAGIRHVHPHIFRHTFATELVDEGVPLETIQKLLGHRGIAMTQRYAKKRAKGLREAVDRLGR